LQFNVNIGGEVEANKSPNITDKNIIKTYDHRDENHPIRDIPHPLCEIVNRFRKFE
jgi:hypothetical protein